MPRDYALNHTPPEYMHRPAYACDDGWIASFLDRIQVGYVATRWDQQPFITPVTFWFDRDQRMIAFHTNLTGRLRANSTRHSRVCFAASETGKLLPSNIALEFSIQYASVVAFGKIHIVAESTEQRRILTALVGKYFPDLNPGVDYRPITENELNRTAVYRIEIERWSGKRNWPEQADQNPDWKPKSPDEGC